jgi:hypothetical protein
MYDTYIHTYIYIYRYRKKIVHTYIQYIRMYVCIHTLKYKCIEKKVRKKKF